MTAADGGCLWSDRYRLAAAFSDIQAELVEDDRGSRLTLNVPPEVCPRCHGRFQIEDPASRSLGICPVAKGSSSLRSFLMSVNPTNPDRVLREAATLALSPAFLDRLVLSASSRVGGVFLPPLTATAIAARLAWLTGARTAVANLAESSTNAGLMNAALTDSDVIFLETNGKIWEGKLAEILDSWINRCQLGRIALWISMPAKTNLHKHPSDAHQSMSAGRARGSSHGALSRQIAARVARTRERHWTSWLSSQSQSRLLEVCDIQAEFDK